MDKNEEYWLQIFSSLNESQRRKYAGQKAIEFGYGGITYVKNITNLAFETIKKGINELKSNDEFDLNRIRKKGGGRKKLVFKNPTLLKDLEELMEENTIGDPMSTLVWTNKSTYTIADFLKKKNHQISKNSVGRILKENNYSLQSNKKMIEGNSNISSEKRDSQFKYINTTLSLRNSEIIGLSVDCKKKELIGNFKNEGRIWKKQGKANKVNVYDFPSLSEGKAIPYGTYDIQKNLGFVNIGITSDTGEFAVNSIKQWYIQFGKNEYPKLKELIITADGGGSNGSRNRLWKLHLQKFANDIGIKITILHFPPGTSKWNQIERKLFSYISKNWKGKPLISYEVTLNLISNTKTKKGLKVLARLDKNNYEKGIKISDKEIEKLNLKRHEINPEWNYTISPQK